MKPEVIGNPDCPILHRWTLFGMERTKDWPVKVMLHHFLPNADDRDVHDHPRPFWTLVLRGSYDDMAACERCAGRGFYSKHRLEPTFLSASIECEVCKGKKVTLNERMRPGTLRHRSADHAHRTMVGPKGCWTIVVMGPRRRPWGFWREGRWWAYRDYEARFGFGMRCERDDAEPDIVHIMHPTHHTRTLCQRKTSSVRARPWDNSRRVGAGECPRCLRLAEDWDG